MFKVLLQLGLIVTPFFFLPGLDMRDLKMASAIVFAMALIAAGLYSFRIRKFPNKWLLILLAYLPISIYLSPAPSIKLVGLDVSSFWTWEPLFQILMFSILAVVVSSYEFEWADYEQTIRTMVYCGTFMAAYMILQYFFIDQFFEPYESFIPGRGQVSGFIGNPTLVAPFVAMLIPLAIYRRSYCPAVVMGLAVILTKSQVGIGAMVVSLLFLLATKGPKWLALTSLVVAISALAVGYDFVKNDHRKFIQDSGRFQMWKQIAIDIKSPIAKDVDNAYPLTGRGLGSFKYVFHIEHPGTEQAPNRFVQAHNDFLEFTYSAGVAGLFLLLMAIKTMWVRNLRPRDLIRGWCNRRKTSLLASFLCIALSAFGTFAWQVGTCAFYTVILVGLLHNDTI